MRTGGAMSIVSTAGALMGVWLCLTLSFHPQELILGAAVSLIVAAATGGGFTGNLLVLLKPRRILAAIGYVVYFLGQMALANLDVMLRVLRLRVPVNPGIVRASLAPAEERARSIVANSITLTPGTLTVDMTEDSIYVHWISLPRGDAAARTQKMVDGFARRLEMIY